ncbi:unnamed protein product, partial [marine sediment metagenome]
MKKLQFNKKLKLVPLFIFLFIGGVALGAILYSNVITQTINLHSTETRIDLAVVDPSDTDVYNGDGVSSVVSMNLLDVDFIDTPFVLNIIWEHEDTQPDYANGDIRMNITIVDENSTILVEASFGEGSGNFWLPHGNFSIMSDPFYFGGFDEVMTFDNELNGIM